MPKIHYTRFPVTSPYFAVAELLRYTCWPPFSLIYQVDNSPQQVGNKSLQWNSGNDKTQQTQRTFARANLLRTCRLCCGLVADRHGEK